MLLILKKKRKSAFVPSMLRNEGVAMS